VAGICEKRCKPVTGRGPRGRTDPKPERKGTLGLLAGIVGSSLQAADFNLAGATVQAAAPRDASLVVAATALFVIQAGMIGGLLLHWRRRRRVEAELTAKETALRGSYEEIRTLAGRLLRAQEDERTRIARELHDDVSQSIAGICLQIAALRDRAVTGGDPDLRQALASLHDAALNVADDIRALSHDLHPQVLRHIGLVPALAAHCDEMRGRYECDIGFAAAADIGHVPNESALCLYRIAQEAIHNSCRHSRAGRTTVSLSRDGGDVELTVTDDGVGFDLDQARRRSDGLGLVSMHERVRLANGSLAVDTGRGRGTSVSVRVPIVEDAPASQAGWLIQTSPSSSGV
jgi:signal transduction histidine kinase